MNCSADLSTRIASVTAVPLSATWEKVFGSAEAVPRELRHPASHFMSVPRTGQFSTVVTVTAENGAHGIGEAWGLPLPGVTAAIINDFLAPLLAGRALGEHRQIWEMLLDYFARLGHTRGGMMEALSGVDIALWDLRAKLAGRPACDLLGELRRERVETYASPVLFRSTPAESAEVARKFCDQGFRAVKIKAGRGVAVDAGHIAAVRAAVGPEVELMVDVNGGYDAERAIALAEKIAPLRIGWIEEPVPPERTAELARVRRASPIPIAAGENDFTPRAFADLLEAGAIDVVQPNVTRAGGITGVLEIAGLARRHGATVSLHGVGSGVMQYASLHVMSVLPHARFFELNQFPNPLRDRLATPGLRFEGGFLDLPRATGLGCEIDQATVERFRA